MERMGQKAFKIAWDAEQIQGNPVVGCIQPQETGFLAQRMG
jgi:hypothetical protein